MNSSLGFSALKIYYFYQNWKEPFDQQLVLYHKQDRRRAVQLGSVSKWFWKKLRHLYQKHVWQYWFIKAFSYTFGCAGHPFCALSFPKGILRYTRYLTSEEEKIREAFGSTYFSGFGGGYFDEDDDEWYSDSEYDDVHHRKTQLAMTHAKMLIKRGLLTIANTRKGTFLRPEEPHGGRDDGNELDEGEEKALEYYRN